MRKVTVIIMLMMIIAFVSSCSETAPVIEQEKVVVEEVTEVVLDNNEIISIIDDDTDTISVPLAKEFPRYETLFIGGLQWEISFSNNPFAKSPNNNMVVATETGGSNVLVYETLFTYNGITSELHPLLATGQPNWNEDMSVLTIDLNPDAHFNNGTAFTAHDVIATYNTILQIGTDLSLKYAQSIKEIVEVNPHAIDIHLNMDNFKPSYVIEFITRTPMLSADDIEARMSYHDGNIEAFRNDPWDEPIHTGPYTPIVLSYQMIALERNDNYWGQAASMWGMLPAPRFLVHNIFNNYDEAHESFKAGYIDIMLQGYNVVPSVWFNTTHEGLNNSYVQTAIIYAIDYQFVNSYTSFSDSQSFVSPITSEQALFDNPAHINLQWTNHDIEHANTLLDEIGIIDHSGDGIREFPPGNNLEFTLMSPINRHDLQTSINAVFAAGASIGINIITNSVELDVLEHALQTSAFDIVINTNHKLTSVNMVNETTWSGFTQYINDVDYTILMPTQSHGITVLYNISIKTNQD